MQKSEAKPSVIRFSLMLFTILSGAVSLMICLHIEILNARSGFFLPRELDPEWTQKWRQIPVEYNWRKENSIPRDQPLTSAEQGKMETDPNVLKYRAVNRLRHSVSLYGLLQYPIVAVTFLASILGLIIGNSRGRWWLMIPLSIVCFTGYRMLALSYFSSLGW